ANRLSKKNGLLSCSFYIVSKNSCIPVIIIFMCISFLQRAFNQSFGLVELIFIALAIISLVNISTIKKMYSVEAIKTNIEK
ncbi:hypothetical protein, partial [Listeria seeligeri]|uniref:hypothetical protein n=1 Tax=Listeria seeligeri TaxID=1640 RepID=UPI001C8C2B4C